MFVTVFIFLKMVFRGLTRSSQAGPVEAWTHFLKQEGEPKNFTGGEFNDHTVVTKVQSPRISKHGTGRTDKLGRMGKEGRRSWILSSGPSRHRIRCTDITTSRCGSYGIIILFSLRRKKDEVDKCFVQEKKKQNWAGWRPLNDEAKIEYKNVVMTKKGHSSKRRPGNNTKKTSWRQRRRWRTPQSPKQRSEANTKNI